MRVLLIGVDGDAWQVIEKLIERGELPTISRLLQEGCKGILRSTIPPSSVPAWNAITTGLNPGKLGILNKIHRGTYEYVSAWNSIYEPQIHIWDYLGKAGYKVIIANPPHIPYAYRVNGVMLAGFTCIDMEKLTYPSSLKEELQQVVGDYEVDVSNIFGVESKLRRILKSKKMVNKVLEVENKHHLTFRHLLKKYAWDFAFIVYVSPDRIQHISNNLKEIYKIYIDLDEKLADILEIIGNDTYIFLISDHGFTFNAKTFYINKWLEDNKYLRSRRGIKTAAGDRLRNVLSIYIPWITPNVIRLLPNKFLRKFERKLSVVELGKETIDWDNTLAFSYGIFGEIWINLKSERPRGIVAREEYDLLVKKLHNDLKKFFDSEGINVDIAKKDEVWKGRFVHGCADLVIVINSKSGIKIDPSFRRKSCFSSRVEGGTHSIDGIFIAVGPEIMKSKHVGIISAYDLLPTILHIFQVAIPRNCDGRIIKELFVKESKYYRREPIYKDYDNSLLSLESKLRSIRFKYRKLMRR